MERDARARLRAARWATKRRPRPAGRSLRLHPGSRTSRLERSSPGQVRERAQAAAQRRDPLRSPGSGSCKLSGAYSTSAPQEQSRPACAGPTGARRPTFAVRTPSWAWRLGSPLLIIINHGRSLPTHRAALRRLVYALAEDADAMETNRTGRGMVQGAAPTTTPSINAPLARLISWFCSCGPDPNEAARRLQVIDLATGSHQYKFIIDGQVPCTQTPSRRASPEQLQLAAVAPSQPPCTLWARAVASRSHGADRA